MKTFIVVVIIFGVIALAYFTWAKWRFNKDD